MSAKDPRDRILSAIDTSKLRVKIKSEPIIFMCGGALRQEQGKLPSVRQQFVEYLSSEALEMAAWVQCAEHINDWYIDSTYSDLQTFERHIAKIADVTVLILESAGTLTELGMFAENSDLSEKLIIFVDTWHFRKRSFISHGPLKCLESNKGNRIYTYHLGQGLPREFDENYLESIYGDISSCIVALDRDVKFDSGNEGHIVSLIVSLLWLFKALTLQEVTDYLVLLDVEIGRTTIKQLIFTATKFDFIYVEEYSKQKYYKPGKKSLKIDVFSASESIRYGFEVQNFYDITPSQAKRSSVLKRLKVIR